MPTLLLTYNSFYVRVGLAAVAVLLVLGCLIYYVSRVRKARMRAAGTAAPATGGAHLFENSYRPGTSTIVDVFRAALIVLALVVAAGMVLILLPQRSVDRMTDAIRSRTAGSPAPEQISLLYLGDEVRGKEFHIRGAIRNISTQPLERVDTMIRLYAPNGELLETAVVRMESEMIAPDAISTFHLTYPDYGGQFASYAVDFKLRDGETLPYKDMRSAQKGS